jgi:HAT1-interacting factor 1
MAAAELDRELNAARAGSSTATTNAPVNDLTAVVKKKKKPAEASQPEPSSGKRKAEDEAPGSPGSDKKIKMDEETQK